MSHCFVSRLPLSSTLYIITFPQNASCPPIPALATTLMLRQLSPWSTRTGALSEKSFVIRWKMPSLMVFLTAFSVKSIPIPRSLPPSYHPMDHPTAVDKKATWMKAGNPKAVQTPQHAAPTYLQAALQVLLSWPLELLPLLHSPSLQVAGETTTMIIRCGQISIRPMTSRPETPLPCTKTPLSVDYEPQQQPLDLRSGMAFIPTHITKMLRTWLVPGSSILASRKMSI